jgi:putative hydrolase of the HAD superfamily
VGKRFEALIFDLDDTLWEVAPVIVRAEHAMYRFLAQHYSRVTELHDLASMRDRRAAMAALHPAMRHDFTWLRLEALRDHAAEAGYAESMADAAFEVFYAARNQVDLYPDVLPALELLRREHRLFALSNGNADLARIGLDGYFELHVTARAAGALKPDPRAFRCLLDACGVDTVQMLHVGDDPDADIGGAQGAGIATAWINRTSQTWPSERRAPDYVACDLAELARTLGVSGAR